MAHGSKAPRKAAPGRERIGRPPGSKNVAVPQNIPPPSLWPIASYVFVEGRTVVGPWTAELRADLARLTKLALRFGLVVQEVEHVSDKQQIRRSWTRKRIDLDIAFAAIEDEPGISFDKWAVETYLQNEPRNPTTIAAARQKATVALSRLYRDGRVEKSYDGEGNMLLTAVPDAFAPNQTTGKEPWI